MKLKRFSFVLLLISLSLVLGQESKQQILLTDVNNPKTEIKVLSESEGEIIIQFSVDDFYFERLETENGIFSKLTFEDCKSTIELGKPQLPVFRKMIELPYDANPAVEIVSSTAEELDIVEKGLTTIYPLQYPVSKTPEYKPFEYDEEVYKTDEYYPNNIFDITDIGLLRKHNLYQITVFPIQYNPVLAKLKVYTKMTFKVYFNTDKSSSTQLEIERYQSELFDQIVNSVSFNDESQKSVALMKTATELPSTFLIICHDDFYNTISSFISHKEDLGYDVTVVKKSDLEDQTASGIRNYIINAYNNWDPPVENVLLVGDVAYIPTFTGDYCNKASDLKYSLMDGDWLPDVFIGRFSVETTTQLSNIINKQIDYETENWSTVDWTKKAVFMASNDHYTISEGTHNYVIENYLEPEGYTCDKLYCYTYSATTTQVINAFNDGRIYGVYSGHGSETSWADGPALSQSQVRNLTNSYKLPLVFSFACLTGKFNYASECFGETWLRESNKAAVGFWGSSNSTYWDEDDILERRLFSSIYDDIETSFGEMTVEAKVKFIEHFGINYGYAKYYLETYNILGDPSLNYAHGVSGTIVQSTTWSGKIIVISNVTVNNGVTLTINPGTHVIFKNGTSLRVFGTLSAEGTSDEPIVFTSANSFPNRGDWDGIYLYDDSCILKYCDIEYAGYGVCCYYAHPTIQYSHFENDYRALYLCFVDDITVSNCTIENNYTGINAYQSNNVDVISSNIKNCYFGAYLYISSVEFNKCNITNNTDIGVYTSSKSYVNMDTWRNTSNPYTNNRILNNNFYGVYISSNSGANLGNFVDMGLSLAGGFNIFTHSSSYYDVWNSSSSAIMAQVNQWTSMNNYGTVTTSPTAADRGFVLSKSISDDNPDEIETLFRTIYQLERDSLYTDAIKVLNSIADLSPDHKISNLVINGMFRLYRKIGDLDGLIENLDNLIVKYQKNTVGIAALDYSVTVKTIAGDYKDAIDRSDRLIDSYKKYGGTENQMAWALYEQGQIIQEMEKQSGYFAKSTGKSSVDIFAMILEKYPESEAAEAIDLMDIEIEPETEKTAVIPQKFALDPAYPNPFNATTVIRYQLPQETHVKVHVYNINGQLVQTLVNERQTPGFYSVNWNSAEFASGIYLYQIVAGDFQQVRKCMVIK